MSDDGWSLFGAREKYAEARRGGILIPPFCEVCGKPVREGLRFCSGMSPCLKKGIGIMSDDGMSGSIKPFKVDDLDEDAGLPDPHGGSDPRLHPLHETLVKAGFKPTDDPAVFEDRDGTRVRFGPVERGNFGATETTVGQIEKNDPINPNHYKQGPVELIEVFEEMGIAEDFCHGNMIKYLERAGVKDPAKELEDFRKARWYAKRLVKIVGERVLAKRSK